MPAQELDLSRAEWRTSSRSGSNGACVQVAALPGKVAVRDSKNPDGGVLILGPAEWNALITRIKNGELP